VRWRRTGFKHQDSHVHHDHGSGNLDGSVAAGAEDRTSERGL
jgi:hypothetical protein